MNYCLPVPAVAFAAAIFFAGPCSADSVPAELADRLTGFDIVILGEVHDNPEHHLVQAELIARLGPNAVVFEMLTPVQAGAANKTAARGGALAEILNWSESGWPDWGLYEPVFTAIDTTAIHGMALPREEVRAAVSEGAAAVFGADADRFGLDDPLQPDVQSARERLQQEAHCNALPDELLPGMVEAQRLRDAAFARTVLNALEQNGAPVIVIVGTGHARSDWGIPAVLRRAAPSVSVTALGQFETVPDEPAPFDSWLVAEPAERSDPCAAFK